jgi:hypothetical protein
MLPNVCQWPALSFQHVQPVRMEHGASVVLSGIWSMVLTV